jgi:23S rRNA pseudouridine2605 synthase
MTDRQDASRPEASGPVNDAVEAEAGVESPARDALDQTTAESIVTGMEEAVEAGKEAEGEAVGPPAKLERLQKILAQAGIASRRHAEELITQGRVQVNGSVVTTLGSKADPSRDHIRVDGKLLKGAERVRYFVMNKPKGFVTTVSDPEGRPTVMQFFEKMRERLYPVGRLDYLSEGLLLVTNDGDLANKLTKAASGVEKTYLVKVSGQPTEEELDRLREGVAIDRGKPGSGQVHTAPARVRQVRQGDNPWYEVVLIEGRNRELRKMFEEIGHFVEKIRRVGYGPLVLDLEPGKIRELDPGELEELRKAAEGGIGRKPKQDKHRRKAMDAQLPAVAPKRGHAEPSERGFRRSDGTGESRPKRRFDGERAQRPAGERNRGSDRREDRGQERRVTGPDSGRRTFGGEKRTDAGRSFGTRPAWKKSGAGDRPSPQPRGEARRDGEGRSGFERPRPPRRQMEEFSGDRRSAEGGASEYQLKRRPGAGQERGGRAEFGAPRPERPRVDRPRLDRQGTEGAGGYRREGGGSSNRGGATGRDSAQRPERKSGGWRPKGKFSGQARIESGQRPRRGPAFGSGPGATGKSRIYSGRPTRSADQQSDGARPGGSGAQRTGPGVRQGGSGARRTGLGARPGGSGTRRTGPGARPGGSGARRTGPGARPGNKRSGPAGRRRDK